VNKIADLRACRLVCTKWFCIIEQRVQLMLHHTTFNEINDSIYTLLRQPKNLSLLNITFDNVSVEFAEILRNCGEVTIRICTFKNVESLKTVLLSCKNLKVFKMCYSMFRVGVIEGIIADAQHEEAYENAEIGLLSITFTENNDSWKLIKTFKALGIQLNSLGLAIKFNNSSMELIKYVKENYVTKLKNLTIYENFDDVSISHDLLGYIGEWNDFQLQSLHYVGTGYGLTKRQTALRHHQVMFIRNIERFPISLRHICIEINQENAQTTVDILSELKHLQHLNIKVYCEGRCKLNFSVLRHMIQLQELSLQTVYHKKDYGIDLDLQDLCNPLQKMRHLKILDGVQIGYKTLQKIIEIMPNLNSLELSDFPKMVSVLNSTLQKQNREFFTFKMYIGNPSVVNITKSLKLAVFLQTKLRLSYFLLF
jgi:hypothetical protein